MKINSNFFFKITASFLISIPVGFIASLSMTHKLRQWENTIPLELAGHSGPAPWVMFAIIILIWIVLVSAFLKVGKN